MSMIIISDDFSVASETRFTEEQLENIILPKFKSILDEMQDIATLNKEIFDAERDYNEYMKGEYQKPVGNTGLFGMKKRKRLLLEKEEKKKKMMKDIFIKTYNRKTIFESKKYLLLFLPEKYRTYEALATLYKIFKAGYTLTFDSAFHTCESIMEKEEETRQRLVNN